MKLAIRIFALTIVFAGLAAAKVSMATPTSVSHQSANSAMPMTFCVSWHCDLWTR